jgi:hypothetical protein
MGDTVEATVEQALPGGRYLLNVKGAALLADSQVPLTAGERITLQVEKLTPGILLRLTSSTKGETDVVNKYLLLHRANPAALGDIFKRIGELLANAKALPPSLSAIGNNLEKISQLSENILISGTNRASVNNMTDYARNLGLNMEHELVKCLVQGTEIANTDQASVKRLFMEMMNTLAAALDDPSYLDEGIINQLKQLRAFSEESIASLEAHQVINVLSRESGGPYILQLPFSFPEGVRMQDIYLEREKDQGKDEDGKAASFRMIIFLDLDQIGEITLDARLQGKRVDCVFHCQNEDISSFIGNYFDELQEKLIAAGYDVGGVQCLVEENIQLIRNEYLSRQPFNNRLALNLFA